MTRTYTREELFKDIPGDPDHILLTIPAEFADSLGLKENDEIVIRQEGDSLYLEKINKEG